jgi:hypothetical protein
MVACWPKHVAKFCKKEGLFSIMKVLLCVDYFLNNCATVKNGGCYLQRFSCISLTFPYVFPIPLFFYISFFHSLSSSSPHLPSPSLPFSCFAISPLLLLHLRPDGLSTSPHPHPSSHPEHHGTQNTSCKRSRLQVPALYNRSRKLLVVARPQ